MAIYMQVNGVTGTATDNIYPNWIVLQSIHWGIHVDVSATVGSSGSRLSAGKITPSDVSIQKDFDTASVPLLKLAFGGTTQTSPVVIVVTQQATDVGTTYLKYTLTNVIVSSFSQGGGSSGSPSDTFTLNFTQIEIAASPTDSAGNPIQSVGGYNFQTATNL
jgi:type VI secretion system secreted protein Hcp